MMQDMGIKLKKRKSKKEFLEIIDNFVNVLENSTKKFYTKNT